MKVLATADLHGFLPKIEPCDLLLIAGDVCPDFLHGTPVTPDHGEVRQAAWLDTTFREWLEEIPAKEVAGIAGNHDFVFENTRFLIPRGLRWHYLRDETCTVQGLTIHGIPWVPKLQRWAFYLPDHQLQLAYNIVPQVDLVLSHGPPLGYLDHTVPYFGDTDAGSDAANTMLERVKPRFFICGHIHEAFGVKRHHNDVTDVYNVAHVNEEYDENRFRPPMEIPVDRTY